MSALLQGVYFGQHQFAIGSPDGMHAEPFCALEFSPRHALDADWIEMDLRCGSGCGVPQPLDLIVFLPNDAFDPVDLIGCEC